MAGRVWVDDAGGWEKPEKMRGEELEQMVEHQSPDGYILGHRIKNDAEDATHTIVDSLQS